MTQQQQEGRAQARSNEKEARQFTPGPWASTYGASRASNFGDWTATVHATVGRDEMRGPVTVARVSGGVADDKFSAEANARLIAAAPEMFDALMWLAEMAEYAWDHLPPNARDKRVPEMPSAIEQARAAIAKATAP
jgi:hypothetical protein